MTRMVRLSAIPLPHIPGKKTTGPLDFYRDLPLPYTAMTDYAMKFSAQTMYKFLAAIFVDEDAKSGPGPWWYGVAVRADPWPNLPQFKEGAASATLRSAKGFLAGEHMPFNLNTAVIFFHPSANQGKPPYLDKDYSSGPHGPWIKLFEDYIVKIGIQVAAISVSPILIMPLIPYTGLGAFQRDWQKIVSQIVSSFKHLRDPNTTEGAAIIRYLVLSSFSNGLTYMSPFLKMGAGVQSMTRAVIDLDGHPFGLSVALASDKYKTFAYDQAQVTPKGPFFHPFGRGHRIHVPGVRWPRNKEGNVRDEGDTHGMIPTFMLYDGLVLASVGY